MSGDRALCLKLMLGRERADRLLKRVAKICRNSEDEDLSVVALNACTECTLMNCNFDLLPHCCSVRFPGGYLFYYWLLLGGPKWVFVMLKERFEVHVLGLYGLNPLL